MISVTSRGSFDHVEGFLRNAQKADIRGILEKAAMQGQKALEAATPIDTSIARNSWGYEIDANRSGARITWTNSDVENGFPVAIMIQYGHGTGTGGYVQGIDFINPAMRPIFDQIANEAWKAVTSG